MHRAQVATTGASPEQEGSGVKSEPAARCQLSSRIAMAAEWAAATELEVRGKHVKRGSELLPPSEREPRHAVS